MLKKIPAVESLLIDGLQFEMGRGGAVISLDLDKVVIAFGGGWLALLALTIFMLGVAAAAGAKPFFEWLTKRHKDDLDFQKFIRNFDSKVEKRSGTKVTKGASGKKRSGR